MAKISVIVPVYKVEDYLEKCIDSIVKQTFYDLEIILVNDGSPDNSLAICRQYEAIDHRIVIVNKENGGLSDARNAGLAVASSDVVYFLDGDDSIDLQCLEKAYRSMVENDSDMVIFDVYQHSLVNKTIEVITSCPTIMKPTSCIETPSMLVETLNCAWNKLYKKKLFTDNNIEYPFACYYEDLGTTYRLMLSCNKISFVHEPLYHYLKDRPGNITQSFNEKSIDVLKMIQLNIDFLNEKNLMSYFKEELTFLASVNIHETLKKTSWATYDSNIKQFIDSCFKFLDTNFPNRRRCKYKILREKNDWIYSRKWILKLYLWWRSKR